MTFSPRAGAAALIGAAGLYLVAVLATGRSARADVPPDVTPRTADAALDVWKAAAGLVQADGKAAVLDVRPAEAFARYHLPGAESVPGVSAADLAARAAGAPFVLVYAGKDEVAQKLVLEARRAAPGAPIHWLADGARAWYLALALPEPLFAEAAPPDGYADALAKVQGFLARPDPAARGAALEAIQALAKASYQPTLLRSGGPKASGGSKKKISGGCG